MKPSRPHIAVLATHFPITGAAGLLLLAASGALSQDAAFARWKNDAAGVYTVTMDDFCADHITGIQNHADTMFYNRGLPMAFGAVMGDCDENDWKIAERMLGHGHELMNHSWSHACGQAGLDWCQPYWGEDKYALEIDKATLVAEERLRIKVRFYIFPYDVWEPSKLAYLEKQGYLGARSGQKGGLNPADFRDGFNLAFDVNWPRSDAKRWEMQKYTLNNYVDEAIAKGGWAIRETHGVNDSSWGYLLPDELRDHLDYAKQKVGLGLLWVAGPSEVLKYRLQRDTYQVGLLKEQERALVIFAAPGLDTTVYNAPLTLLVKVPATLPSGWQVYQQGKVIPHVLKGAPAADGQQIRFNALPHRGSVVITANPMLSTRGVPASRKPALALSPSGRIHFRLPAAGAFRLELVATDGRLHRTVARGVETPGAHSAVLDPAGLRPGLYLLRLVQAGVSETLRLPLIR